MRGLGARRGLGDYAAAIEAHRHGMAQLGVLSVHLDLEPRMGSLEHPNVATTTEIQRNGLRPRRVVTLILQCKINLAG